MTHTSAKDRMSVSAIFIIFAMTISKASAQPRAPELIQVVTKLQSRLRQAQGLSLRVEASFAKGQRIEARIMAISPNYLYESSSPLRPGFRSVLCRGF
jgi:hypothetical protein